MAERLLEGIRILDLTMAYAGPIGTRVLADMGAEVIKIESVQRIDMPCRRISYAENKPGKEPWNCGGYFHRLNVGKYGITLNLDSPEGKDIFKRLVKISDAVIESFTPRVMDNFGLGYEALKVIKHTGGGDSMCGYGHTGPQRDYTMYQPGMEASAGLPSITGYADGPPLATNTGYGDWLLGMTGMAALLTALYYRQRTGKGQYIDVAGREATICHLGEAIMDYTMNDRVWTRQGNRHPSMAPHGCYRCKGEDKWINIAVETDEEWQSLCQAIGNPTWVSEERFSDALSRWQNQDELNELIEQWTKEHDHYEVMHLLQQAGVPSGAVLNIKEVIMDHHLKERGFFEVIEHHGGIGKRPHPKQLSTKFSQSQSFIPKPGPFLGEDNEYVYCSLVGMSKEELAELEEKKVIGNAPTRFPSSQERPLPIDMMVKEGSARVESDYLEQLSKSFGIYIGPTT